MFTAQINLCVCFYHFNMQCIKPHILSIYFVFSTWIYVYMKNYIHFTGQSQRNLTMQTQHQIPSFFLECLPCEASWGPDVEEDASLRRLSCMLWIQLQVGHQVLSLARAQWHDRDPIWDLAVTSNTWNRCSTLRTLILICSRKPSINRKGDIERASFWWHRHKQWRNKPRSQAGKRWKD